MSTPQTGVRRREFLQVAAGAAVACLIPAHGESALLPPEGQSILNVKADGARALVPFLSWDTEGGERYKTNLLRSQAGISLRLRVGGEWRPVTDFPTTVAEEGREGWRYQIKPSPGLELLWRVRPGPDRLSLVFSCRGAGKNSVEAMQLLFPFDPRVTPTTVLPKTWSEGGLLELPAVLSAPDFGQMLLAVRGHPGVNARLKGSRKRQTVDLIVELPSLSSGGNCTLDLTPVRLAAPSGLQDQELWRMGRRGWFNAWQPSSEWGDQDRPFSAPPGILANNVISDPASMSLIFYADHALWTPEIAPGISIAALVRQTVDWWLEKRTRSTGQVVGYWDYTTFLDANAGPLIAAWDYVEATGDTEWLARRIDRLEFIADYLMRRDVDGDGMVEATQTGNGGALVQPNRSCCWFDALNCGHQDGYSNALIYRAWRCLADLESKLGRAGPQARYRLAADRLRAAYTKTLYNPETGWLAWWRSADGHLHDYATPIVNGMAIEYGLVGAELGRKILSRLWKKIRLEGFNRFDLGVPCTLVPVHRSDYLLPDSLGCPKREDGRDAFQQYMNGGITAGQGLHFLAAHYVVGEPEKADRVLKAMLGRQAKGGFQDGVRDKYPEGIDWTTWDGKGCGYEGYLADVYFFLLAILLREPSLRARYDRPLTVEGA